MASLPLNADSTFDDGQIQDAAHNAPAYADLSARETEQALFTPEFLSVDVGHVVDELNQKGYFAFPSALSPEAIETIERDATETKHELNVNKVSGVFSERQYYLTNLLAISRTFYEFSTSPFVFGVCEGYLGDQFRLKALRYYETYGGHHMQWHTDNKTDREFAHIPGIIFIFYVSDVEDGEFQYVEGSHLWSGEKAYSDYTDEFIADNFSSSVKSFKMPRGSLVIYNTYGIHRARPVADKNFVRKSVFFQVDSEINKSEPIIVNTEFISRLDDRISTFLGFGRPSNYEVFPNTSLNSLPLDGTMMSVMGKYMLYRMARSAFASIPQALKPTLRKMIGR
ncbi:phytanoyl-CoA dioxygenase family protein [Caballeronia novacaledonica]|uniref:Phytanoyl-CoA dioxygenase family protein n=2 Tax=Caballeronia novacaledonica TaxID=1544861 RepID=A0AA37IAN1_9BURK|nr:phytanoyl-CoA dioxygenase family protein [Caballeronia novacaledonica]GJH19921.1 phytanoyl-CoA dioxygenase family protein [Caballeronia novacaledonica]GJH25714.1 phytanoyl-CoA dioxygenase family protein [Caballeronia novacaledonica]